MCEGRNTEPQYLRGFAADCKNPRVTVVVHGSAGVPKSVVGRARDLRQEAADRSEAERDENLTYEGVWAVFDVDEHPGIPDAIQLARDNGIRLAVSNPCFELWLLLHFREQPGMKHRHELLKLLKKHVPGYEKKVDFAVFKTGYADAVRRAAGLGPSCETASCRPGPNPSTGVHDLTAAIAEAPKV